MVRATEVEHIPANIHKQLQIVVPMFFFPCSYTSLESPYITVFDIHNH